MPPLTEAQVSRTRPARQGRRASPTRSRRSIELQKPEAGRVAQKARSGGCSEMARTSSLSTHGPASNNSSRMLRLPLTCYCRNWRTWPPTRCRGSRSPLPLDHHGSPRHVAAGCCQGTARPFPISGARLHQAPQGLGEIGTLPLNGLFRPGAVAGEADRVLGTAVRTGAPAATTPDAAAGDAGSEVAVAPVATLASGCAARPLPRTPSRVWRLASRRESQTLPHPSPPLM